jgi:hypothetical protein
MEVRKKSEEAGKILAQPPDSVFLGATEYSPAVAAVDSEKTYELRVYEVTEGRMERLNNRFRDVTTAYFNKHGITSVAYWLPLDEPASQNKLYYILQFDSHDDAKAKWKSLSGDQEWKAAFAATQPDGSLVKGRPASIYMRPTDYSPRPVATE